MSRKKTQDIPDIRVGHAVILYVLIAFRKPMTKDEILEDCCRLKHNITNDVDSLLQQLFDWDAIARIDHRQGTYFTLRDHAYIFFATWFANQRNESLVRKVFAPNMK